jgi:hypothetical protein
VLHFGHWLPGAADFLGEEQEQVFATQGPRSNTSKHMSRSGTLSVRRKILFAFYFYGLKIYRKKGRYISIIVLSQRRKRF